MATFFSNTLFSREFNLVSQEISWVLPAIFSFCIQNNHFWLYLNIELRCFVFSVLKSIKNSYSFIPIAETALKAIGRTALPLTPPYVVRFSFPTAGHAWPFEFRPIKPDTVLIAVTPSAPPCYKIKTFKFTVCNQTKNWVCIELYCIKYKP